MLRIPAHDRPLLPSLLLLGTSSVAADALLSIVGCSPGFSLRGCAGSLPNHSAATMIGRPWLSLAGMRGLLLGAGSGSGRSVELAELDGGSLDPGAVVVADPGGGDGGDLEVQASGQEVAGGPV